MPILLQKSPAVFAFEAAQFLADCRQRGAVQLASAAIDSHQRLWDSPDPQAVLDVYGTAATQLFVEHAAAVTFILGVDPDLIPEQRRSIPPEWSVTYHQDGTVTVTPVPQEPPAAE